MVTKLVFACTFCLVPVLAGSGTLFIEGPRNNQQQSCRGLYTRSIFQRMICRHPSPLAPPPLQVISYALSPINYVLGVEEQPKDGGAAARRFVNQFEAEVSAVGARGTQSFLDNGKVKS